MRILIVGAGAVGQVYGRHLRLGGADVSFLVKPKYRESAEKGFQMYRLRSLRRAESVHFSDFGVLDQVSAVRDTPWDQVWLTVPADALMGPWLDELVSTLSDQSIVVCLSPGYESYQRLLRLVGEDRLVIGMINLISYQAPLDGETRFEKPGVAYWLPPFTSSPLSGPQKHVQEICRVLTAGGQPVARHASVQRAVEAPQAVLMTHLLALEHADWTFAKLRSGNALTQARRGALEAMAIMAKKKGTAVPWWLPLWRPFMGRIGLLFAPHFVPLDLQTYLEYHFTKVRSQTMLFIHQYIEWGEELGLATGELRALLATVET